MNVKTPGDVIANVLFVDMVRYTLEDSSRQGDRRGALREMIRSCPTVQALGIENLLNSDTGDGCFLANLEDARPIYACAVELYERTRLTLPLRIGLHRGLVRPDVSLTGANHIYGDGINFAQRVMDCGETGHLLLSREFAEEILRHGSDPRLKPIGDYIVKHGVTVSLYLFHDAAKGLGNPTPPAHKFPPPTPSTVLPDSPAAPIPSPVLPSVPSEARRVALIYRRNAKPDDHVLGMLERALTAAGHTVFVDRHIETGADWAAVIRREVTTSDAVIPLISRRSIGSEMLEEELKIAHEAGRAGSGRPRLLPVRVAFEEALPPELGDILDSLQYSLWKSPDDDGRVASEILAALQEPKPVATAPREATGGAVPLDSTYYIERRADRDMEEAIAAGESIVLVKGARQVGKTSLLARGAKIADELGCRVVFTDFQSLMQEEFQSADTFCRALCVSLKTQLDLNISINKTWDEDLSAVANLHQFVRRRVVQEIPERVCWAMDEVDKLFTANFSGDIFAIFRVWHNSRATEPRIPWSRLTLALSYATEARLFIRDLNQSPFNVGVAINLADFLPTEVDRLNEKYGSPLRSDDERDRLMSLINGQPFLTRRALDKLARRDLTFSELVEQSVREDGPFGDHLRRLLFVLTQDPEIRDGVTALLHNKPCATEEIFHRLRSGGVVRGETRQDAVLRCELYRRYLSLHF